jgi:hypothetical protein
MVVKNILSMMFLMTCFFIASFGSLQSSESRGKWDFDEVENEDGTTVNRFECKYSLFVKECLVGRIITITPPVD